MIVTIKADIFSDPNNNDELENYLPFFKKGKHRLRLKNYYDLNAFDNSKWKKGLNQSTRDLLMESLEFVSENKKEVVISNLENIEYFKLNEAYQFLDQKLYILVEQIEYEKPFLVKVIQEFDENKNKELINALQKGWLAFYNGAGSNIESVLKERLKKDETTNPLFTKSLEKYLRFFVIKDSDREYCIINADGTITQQKLPKSKTEFLEENKIPFHIFYKREKENYMPDKIYDSFIKIANKKDKKKKFAQVYLGLNPSQKDFLDIEKGFSEKAKNGRKIKDRKNLKSEIDDLYKSLSDAEYRTIGLGIEYPNFKSEFSNNFKNVNKEDLEKRINHQPLLTSKVNSKDAIERNEFEHIINEIKYLL